MTTKNVIIFAGALYDAPLWTNRQHIATRLAERGWRVLYVEPRLWLGRMALRFHGTQGVLRWVVRATYPFTWRVAPNLWVVAQTNVLPGARRWPWIGTLNHRGWNAGAIRRHARRLRFHDPALLIYDTEAAEFLDDFPRSRVVYDCVDDHRSQAGVKRNQSLVDREEAALVARAATISVTTQPLYQRFSKVHDDVRLVPSAADVEAFLRPSEDEPADLMTIPHPRIGTVGALDAYKLDVPLLAVVAERHPEWNFVLVGPRGYAGVMERAEVDALHALPNIYFLGPKPRAAVPAYVHGFDVTIIPYRANAYNTASFPLKFWEFMASGKPVVVSGLPALEHYRALAPVVTTPDECTAAVQAALHDPTRGQAARVTEAKRHHWTARVEAIERLLVG